MTVPVRVLFLGDIVGRAGRKAVRENLPKLREEMGLSFIVANGENASGGIGLTPENAQELRRAGVDVLTSGNHIWKHKKIIGFLEQERWVLRPANYPSGTPGYGWSRYALSEGNPVYVLNLMGRTYMGQADCPFQTAEQILKSIPEESVILVDFHAEATSEKQAMGHFLRGRVTAVLGTHTHVQTNDPELLDGTAYMTDLGMCGPEVSVLGMDPAIIVRRFLTGMPERFQLASSEAGMQGAVLELDPENGRALSLTPFRRAAKEL